MPSQYVYRAGPHDFKDMLTTASSAIARGDPVKKTSGKTLLLTAGAKCIGVSQGVKAVGDSATTAKQVLKFSHWRTLFLAHEKRASGSLAATDEGALVDMSGASGATGFDSSATGNKDIFLDTIIAAGAINVGRANIAFADPAALQY